ncbi:hypothetical protein HWV62_36089 [Athelia sp. TMB]|nr:hypothetical protein HWV62_36089 [Athelia sp. TMB]
MSSPEGLSSHVLAHVHSALTLPQGQYTVLAAFVITSLAHGPKTLALATGAKVLPTSRIPDAGDAPRLHDSHAEVLARRALVRWLYEEIARDIEGEGSMWLAREEGRWGLRDEVQLHLYVSTPPCGDASTRYLAASQDPAVAALKDSSPAPLLEPDSPGLARGRDGYGRLGVLRTKPGRADSPPTTAMSCADKIAAWSVLGVQGALGSAVLKPIYIDSVTIGEVAGQEVNVDEMMVREDCVRAFAGRLRDMQGLPEGYALHEPTIHFTPRPFPYSRTEVALANLGATPKSSNESLVWHADSPFPPEILIGGLRRGVSPKHAHKERFWPRYAKIALLQLHLRTLALLAPPDPRGHALSYHAHKHPPAGPIAVHQRAKDVLMGAGGPFSGWLRGAGRVGSVIGHPLRVAGTEQARIRWDHTGTLKYQELTGYGGIQSTFRHSYCTNMSIDKKLILVIGATGMQGIHVIDSLLAPSEDGSPSPYAIRALTRDPLSERAERLSKRGVECVQGSIEDFVSLQAAFEGVYGVFVNTDTSTIGEQREIYANMRIFEIAKQTKTLRHYVFSGLGYALKMGGYNPEYNKVEHFNGKGRFADWLKAQSSVVDDMALSWSVVNTCLYMEMLNYFLLGPLNKRADGTYVFPSPVQDGHVALIALRDIGFFIRYTFDHRAATSAQTLDIAGEMITWDDLVKTFTKVTGQPAVHKRQTFDEWWKNYTNIDNPMATEFVKGDGSTTFKENMTAFFKLWRDDIVVRDMEWIKSIHPKLQSVEEYMRETKYDGSVVDSFRKVNHADKRGVGLNVEQINTL